MDSRVRGNDDHEVIDAALLDPLSESPSLHSPDHGSNALLVWRQ